MFLRPTDACSLNAGAAFVVAASTRPRCVVGMDAVMGEGRGYRSAGTRLDGAVDARSRVSFWGATHERPGPFSSGSV